MLGSRALPYTENDAFLFPCVLWGICTTRRTLGPHTKGRSSFLYMFPHFHKETNLCAGRFLYWGVVHTCEFSWGLWRFLYWGVFVLLSSLEVQEHSWVHGLRWPSPQENPLVQNLAHNIPQEISCQERRKEGEFKETQQQSFPLKPPANIHLRVS